MRIRSLSFKDNAHKWILEEAEFHKLTLLVGASGVGKTQILRSFTRLKGVASGGSINGSSWQITFSLPDFNDIFTWTGEYENKGFTINDYDEDEIQMEREKAPRILNETINRGSNELVKRTGDEIIFKGNKTVKLPQQQSTVYLLKEEDDIRPLYEGFQSIIYSDQTNSIREPIRIRVFDSQKTLRKLKNIHEIQESSEDIKVKFFAASKNAVETFETIIERYKEIFPTVEDVKFDVAARSEDEDETPFFLKDLPVIQIKEIGIDDWIEQEKISSGMLRTLLHICELYLCAEGTVFLIDEFENSLGINCIDEITQDILSSSRDIQFLLTSHHPYIINNINFESWKLVTRNRGRIKTHDASRFNLGRSKHEKFMQLLQLDAYKTGME